MRQLLQGIEVVVGGVLVAAAVNALLFLTTGVI
jgi:hypothetical protein